MPDEHAEERLIKARSEVHRACDLLIAPSSDTLDGCQDALRRAVSELAGFRSTGTGIPMAAGTRQLACGLRSEVLRAARLLQSMASFYHGWERILGAMTAGYTASGDPAPVTRQGRLCFRG
jgi:hypothetical protein